MKAARTIVIVGSHFAFAGSLSFLVVLVYPVLGWKTAIFSLLLLALALILLSIALIPQVKQSPKKENKAADKPPEMRPENAQHGISKIHFGKRAFISKLLDAFGVKNIVASINEHRNQPANCPERNPQIHSQQSNTVSKANQPHSRHEREK